MYYTLVGQNGNAFCLMGYTGQAMADAHRKLPEDPRFTKEADEALMKDAMSSDYSHLLCVLSKKLDEINEALGYEEPEDEYDDDDEYLYEHDDDYYEDEED